MNTTTENTPSAQFLIRLRKEIAKVNETGRAVFIGVTYTSKSTGETARHVLNLGVSYLNSVRKAIDELSAVNREGLTGLEIQALDEVIASYQNTLDKHAVGEQNDAYTKKGVYLDIIPGLKMSLNDGSFELHAMSVSKVVLIEGKAKKPVNSKPLTIAKNKWKKGLAVEKYRSLAIDVGNFDSIRIGGTELEVSE